MRKNNNNNKNQLAKDQLYKQESKSDNLKRKSKEGWEK